MRIVIALGGNALLREGQKPTYDNQYSNLKKAAGQIAAVARNPSTKLLVTHGNGPQIGCELLRNEYAKSRLPVLPMHILNAETQASIGSMIVAALSGEFKRRGISRGVATVLTHTVVNVRDPAFRHPTKPIGPFYTRAQLSAELRRGRFSYVEERGKFRRVVPSPKPMAVLESAAIKAMVSNGTVVVAGGGGGIPIVNSGRAYAGVAAVIDKDSTARLMANAMHADTLVILTDVSGLYHDYPNSRSIVRRMSARELKLTIPKLEEGTMRPKAEACVRFLENGGSRAYIGKLPDLEKILAGKAGTAISR